MDAQRGPQGTMRVRLLIDGEVQGVGFRWAARREAIALGLLGWILNRRDGRVEAVAEGPSDEVGRFVKWCRQGPPGAHVTDVRVTPDGETEYLPEFTIRH